MLFSVFQTLGQWGLNARHWLTGYLTACAENGGQAVPDLRRWLPWSMTPAERKNPDLLKASRKKRIASGSGTRVEEVNKLLKMHRQMSDLMKQAGRGKGMFARMGGMMGMGAGGPPPVDPAALEKMAKSGQLPALPGGQAPDVTHYPVQ